MTIAGEFLANSAIRSGDVLEGAVNEVEDDRAALDVAEKTSADPGPAARSLDQPGKIGKNELLAVMHPNDPQLRLQGRERIVGNLGPSVRYFGEERRFPGVRQTNEAGIGDQFEAQPNPRLASRPARIGAAGGAIGRILVVGIAESAIAALQQYEPLAGTGQISEHLPFVLIKNLRSDRDPQLQILAAGSAALASGAWSAVLRAKMLPVSVVNKCVEVFRHDEDDVSALAAIAAVRTTELYVFLATKARRAAAAITALQIDLTLIEKLHGKTLRGIKRGTADRSPRALLLLGTAI